jgi:polyhydroxyalkanoate synthesis regulator protein
MYCPQLLKHIYRNDIIELIREGYTIKITKDDTGEDVTDYIVLQALYQYSKEHRHFAHTPMLHAIVRGSGSTLSTLQHSLIKHLDMDKHIDNEIRKRVQALVKSGGLDESVAWKLLGKLTNVND